MSRDEKLEMEEMERLCRRLNISLGKEELLERFKVSSVSPLLHCLAPPLLVW